MKFSNKDFFRKCDQIRAFLRIWSHLLKKSLIETSFFVQWKKITSSEMILSEILRELGWFVCVLSLIVSKISESSEKLGDMTSFATSLLPV